MCNMRKRRGPGLGLATKTQPLCKCLTLKVQLCLLALQLKDTTATTRLQRQGTNQHAELVTVLYIRHHFRQSKMQDLCAAAPELAQ